MRHLIILLAMMLLPVSSPAWGPVAVMAGRAPVCNAPVTGETGDTDNYLSSWSLTGGSCGTLYYHADWGGDGDPRWTITLYSDSGHTQQVGTGSGYDTPVTIAGGVVGSVAVASGPEGSIAFDGTLTR